jgi:hypothetical protein
MYQKEFSPLLKDVLWLQGVLVHSLSYKSKELGLSFQNISNDFYSNNGNNATSNTQFKWSD